MDERRDREVGGNAGDHEHKHAETLERAGFRGPIGATEKQEQGKRRARLDNEHRQGEPELGCGQTVAETPRHDQEHDSRKQLKGTKAG